MELWDVYDIHRYKTGRTHERGVPLKEGDYHLVVHVMIQNDQGEVLISKRAPTKPFGNLWECTGGSVIAGESSLQGALREVKEELGLLLDPKVGRRIHQETRNSSYYDLWLFHSNAEIKELTYQPEEVVDAKWVNQKMYEKMVKNHEIVSHLHHYFDMIFIDKKIL